MSSRQVNDNKNGLQITINTNPMNSSLQISSNSLEIMKDIPSEDNDILVDMEATMVQFDSTLPPGVAPKGFVLVDEDVNTSIIQTDEEDLNDRQNPLFKVKFKNHSTVRKYKQQIEDFLLKLVHGKKSANFDVGDLLLQIFDHDLYKTKSLTTINPSSIKEKNEPLDFALFTIDTDPKVRDDLDIPVYGKRFIKTLEVDVTEETEVKDDCGPKQMCFNCQGNHSLRDCEKPRNFAEINKNRKIHFARRGVQVGRYHLEDDQRFGHYNPGVLSDNLKKALGIQEHELPRYIYRMRVLGYPPGWLEEARLQHSGLSLFNSDGVPEAGFSDEEGEIIIPGDKDQYDINKLIDFPGFNIPNPPGTRDENKMYWGTPQQQINSKAEMLKHLSKKRAKQGYKRKKLVSSSTNSKVQRLSSEEMDFEEIETIPVECIPVKDLFIPPLPKDNPPLDIPPPPPSAEDEVFIIEDESSQETQSSVSEGEIIEITPNDSPTLADLEVKKKNLLEALTEENYQKNALSKTNTPEYFIDTSILNSYNVNTSTPLIIDRVDDTKELNSKETKSSCSKFKTLGTPILESTSPFHKLPSSEHFSKNICDVINFENLPNYTGKYDNMVGLLQKVRSKLSELQQE